MNFSLAVTSCPASENYGIPTSAAQANKLADTMTAELAGDYDEKSI
ncbi:hypothetical protein BPA01_12760 [Brevibacillus parabrevis]|jgi:hypothetical protein|uniref:Uncharacterized protein n=1 Tax=Brevibacillus parabrevis TaxID=54914 RepID=A0A4Y3PIC4_BREPA|nr:hypothetical protein BPA01_12760 [Brevibacillus parabrevis]